MKNKLYNAFLIVFSIIFSIVFIGTIFDNKSLIGTASPLIVIICFVIIGVILIGIYKLLNKIINEDLSLKKELIIVGLLFAVLIVFQLIYAYYMKSYPGWDWNDLFTSARNYVLGFTDKVDWDYFQKFPNNYGMLYFEILIFKTLQPLKILQSTTATIYATIAINIVIIDLAIIFTYLTVRNVLGKKTAVFSLILMLINNAFYCYIPVLYTDTVTMFFPIFILYCYTLWDKKKSKTWPLILIAFASVIGVKIKPTIIIMLIAIIIDIIMKKKYKEIFKPLSIVLAGILVLQLSASFLENKFSIFPYDILSNNKQLPYTHWIMMGMTERDCGNGKSWIGWYNPESMEYTLSYDTTDKRQAANIKKIKEYLKDYKISGYLTFLYRKMLFTWSDGTYYAPALLNNSTIYGKKSTFTDFQHSSGQYINISYVLNTSMILFLYLFLIIGAINSIKKKENKVNSCYVALLGVLIFFLLWEASSRYLINYIPIIIVGVSYGISSSLPNNKQKEKRLKRDQAN